MSCPSDARTPNEVERFDHTWQLYPWQHPGAYWLRANEQAAICTRCGKRFETPEASDLAEVFGAWIEAHLACPLGDGLAFAREGEYPRDPLFEER